MLLMMMMMMNDDDDDDSLIYVLELALQAIQTHPLCKT